MPPGSRDYDFDFAVAGCGPAGSSAAISLAQKGHRVVVFERETFPRFHIGESLLSTANDHLETLGLTAVTAAAKFPEKWGARLYTHDGVSGRGVDFSTVTEVATPRTFQVPRADFDHMLMNRAKELGVDVREGHRVTACDFDESAVTVAFTGGSGQSGRLRVKALVDATGRDGLMARKLNLRTEEPRLANIAIFAHYSGVPRLGGERPDDIRLVARADAGWFWLIPINRELISVGVVLPRRVFQSLPAATNEERLEQAIADTPVMADLMRNARREWPVRVEKDFSYQASTYAGDRWILAGDAGSFLDPIFSTGVSIAMESGIEAAEALHAASERNDFRAKRFKAFCDRSRRRYESFRRFVIGFYTPQFRDLFFEPNPPPRMFRAVVTVLCGRWDPSRRSRLLIRLFFVVVALQKRFPMARFRFRRDAAAGYN
jgi:flavin-dependent dehydrogenase